MVDVLRATSTIIVALMQGAKEIIPCAEVNTARSFRNSHDAVLVGERHAQIIEGFDFTNSPYDLSSEDLSKKTVALTSSTGTKLLLECSGAKHILIASTLNSKSVAEEMVNIGGKWAVIGAGSHGEFRPEDQVGCALVVQHYSNISEIYPDKYSQEIVDVYSENIATHIYMSSSSQKLMTLGRQCDIDFVIEKLNQYSIVPKAFLTTNDYMRITE